MGKEKTDTYGIPGTPEHLCGFVKACGFDQAVALAPFENPLDPTVTARTESGQDNLVWLLQQPGVATGVSGSLLIPAATIKPYEPDAADKVRQAAALGVRLIKIHPLIMNFDPLDKTCAAFF
jgi:hypothetical protein